MLSRVILLWRRDPLGFVRTTDLQYDVSFRTCVDEKTGEVRCATMTLAR
jgi:hypothetical protein